MPDRGRDAKGDHQPDRERDQQRDDDQEAGLVVGIRDARAEGKGLVIYGRPELRQRGHHLHSDGCRGRNRRSGVGGAAVLGLGNDRIAGSSVGGLRSLESLERVPLVAGIQEAVDRGQAVVDDLVIRRDHGVVLRLQVRLGSENDAVRHGSGPVEQSDVGLSECLERRGSLGVGPVGMVFDAAEARDGHPGDDQRREQQDTRSGQKLRSHVESHDSDPERPDMRWAPGTTRTDANRGLFASSRVSAGVPASEYGEMGSGARIRVAG